MSAFSLPKPTETLAGCVWLPRFIAKARLHAAGQLTGDFLLAFCHPRAMDGRFLAHFGLEKETTLHAILQATTDDQLAQWFTTQPGVTAESIATWNELAPLIGSPGHPGERELAFMLRRTYPEGIPPEAQRSSFAAILWDERKEQPQCELAALLNEKVEANLEDSSLHVADAWDAEIDARVASVLDGTAKLISWEESKARLDAIKATFLASKTAGRPFGQSEN